MNKKLTSLITLLLLAVLQLSQAVTVVYTIPAGQVWNATNLFNNALGAKSANITKVVVNTGAGTTVTNLSYALLDFPGFDASKGWGLLYKTNAAYTNFNSYVTNLQVITTNFGSGDGLGNYVTYTNRYTNTVVSALFTYVQTNGIASNAWRILATGTAGSNATTTLIQGDFPVIYGFGFTNNNIGNPITLTVDFEPAL